MKKIILSSLALAALLSFSGCIAAIGNKPATGGTLGQELIDLQKAKETGAITDSEYQDQKAKLLKHK